MRKMQKDLAFFLALAMLLSGAAYAMPGKAETAAELSERPTVVDSNRVSDSAREELVQRYADYDGNREAFSELTETYDNVAAPDSDIVGKKFVRELPNGDYVDGRLLVKVENRPSLMGSGSIFDGISGSVQKLFSVAEESTSDCGVMLAAVDEKIADWYRLDLTDSTEMLSVWNQLLQEDSVLYVEPDYIVQAADVQEVTENDPFIHSQTWLEQIGAPNAWAKAPTAGKDIVVAVVDSGVDLDHPDLENQLLPGYDYVETDADPDDMQGHGTHVAGIIGAQKNAIGGRGVAYNAKILPVRVLNEFGSGYSSDIADGIAWAAGSANANAPTNPNKAHVINLSLGGFSNSRAQRDAINYARSQGCLVVAAAGNESLPTTYAGDSFYGATVTPAGFPGVLTVMAMSQSAEQNGDWLASFSNYDANPGVGAEYEIMAPGTSIYSTYRDGGYSYLQGTSMACPVVAGAAAVLMGMGCTAEEAWELIVSTGTVKQGKTQPDGTVRSYPALDLDAAVAMKKSGSTAYQKAPVAANPALSTALTRTEFGHGEVDFSGLNTSSRMYYYNNALISSLSLSFENFGGTGTVEITGTVGGCPITQKNVSVQAGDVVSESLQFSGTPMSTNGYVRIELYANGEELISGGMQACDLKTPASSGNFYVSDRFYYPNYTPTKLNGSTARSTVWVLDLPLRVPVGYLVTVSPENGQKSVAVYQDRDAYFQTANNSETGAGKLELISVTVLGAGGFEIAGYGDSYILGTTVFDPWIQWVSFANQSFFMGTGYRSLVQGVQIVQSSFTDFMHSGGSTIECTWFDNNLVNRCAYTKIIVRSAAMENTFVENYDPYDAGSVLEIYAQDYEALTTGTVGVYNSNVVGPMKFCWLYNGEMTEYPAKVVNIHYQAADDPDLMFLDRLQYDDGSTINTTWTDLIVYDSPVYVKDTDVEYSYNSEYGSVDFNITYHLSAPISEDCAPYVYSYSDPLTNNAEISVSNDRKTVTAQLTAMMTSPNMVNDYHLAGIYTANYSYATSSGTATHYYWATELSGQVCSAGISMRSSQLNSVKAALSDNSIVVSWSDERIQSTDTIQILRSVDGGEATLLTSLTGADSFYADSDIANGHAYKYTVMVESAEKELWGTANLVLAERTNHGSADISTEVEDAGTLVVSLDSPWLVSGEKVLRYTLPDGMADKIEFSAQLRQSGLSYAALDNGDGTVTVSIGLEDESAILYAGELFTVNAKSGYSFRKADEDVICLKGTSELQLWHLNNYISWIGGYKSGKMTAASMVESWNTARTIRTQGTDYWKLFGTGTSFFPWQDAVTIS